MSRELIIFSLLALAATSVAVVMYSTTNDLKKVNARAKSYMDTAIGNRKTYERIEPIEETQG